MAQWITRIPPMLLLALTVPFFLLTANLMNVGGTTDRLMKLSRRRCSCWRLVSLWVAVCAKPSARVWSWG